METKFTLRAVLWTAFLGTWGYFRGSKLKAAIASVAWLVVSIALLFAYHSFSRTPSSGASAMKEVAFDWAVLTAAVAILWVLGVFLWKLWMAPVRMIGASVDKMEEKVRLQEYSNLHVKTTLEHATEQWSGRFHQQSKRIDNLGDPPLQIHNVREITRSLWEVTQSSLAIDFLSEWLVALDAERMRLPNYDSWPERLNESPGSGREHWEAAIGRLNQLIFDAESYVRMHLDVDLTERLSKKSVPLPDAPDEDRLKEPQMRATYREAYYRGRDYMSAVSAEVRRLRQLRDEALVRLRTSFS
ncbi:MAG: hypothetical protein ACT6TH_08570 [Brevundimonas sp.]